ncbi:MAG TPA: translation initiation factor IF-2, partial [Pyrinomonadaceae bacterium]|nr:translation initiation factor IF-2 [Pyrinomonadaceae bacterium]
IYDLAKDLKIDTKRLIEEVRREGVDVSVPSNSISKELAEKIRDKYFPKQSATVKRAVKIVKKAARPVVEEEAAPAEAEEIAAAAPPPAEPEPMPAQEEFVSPPQPVAPAQVVRRLAPAVRVVKPEAPPAAAPEPPVDEPMAAVPAVAEPVAAEPAPAPARPAPPARQVRVLRPTAAALNAGIRPGERAPAPPPAPSTLRTRERATRGRVEYTGTPGETATPQTTYIPPPDAGRRRSRRGSTRGGKRAGDGRTGRLDRDFTPPPDHRTLEERIAGRIQQTGDLKPIRLVEGSTVKEFAEKLGIKPKEIVGLLLQRGVFATINQALDDNVAADLGKRFGYEVTFVPFEDMVAEEEFEELIATDADDIEVPRAPVVTVMGHVDHGKTSLLDAIRTTDVAGGEAGGITQHIGAYSVQVSTPDNPNEKRRVVFLDTPGHEAFTLMRARGAKATDVVVLVVAADDGVMPQTIEAIEHSRAAGVPIVVAINKVDKPDANPDRVRQELSQQGLNPVAWGGETEMVEVSAKKRQNLDTLLETILLTADILNLRASTTRLASGVVLEAKLDRGRGAVATVLVQQGTLRSGDPFIIGQIFGKVRAMFNDRGEPETEVGPATPVEVLGLQGVPQAGENFQVVADISRAQQISGHRQAAERQRTLIKTTKRGIEALGEADVKELLVVIKADVQGSVEVLKSTLQKMSTERVKVKVVRSGVGAITESDVLLASATQAGATSTAVVIIGFNVRPESRANDLAKQESVDIRLHSIIYKVEEEIKAAMIGMLEKIEREKILGKADVREVFRVPRIGAVAGCMVIDGVIRRNARARLIRDGVVAWEGNIASLRRFKDDASEVREGFECGIGLENFNDVKVSDQIEAYIIEKVAATEL